IYGVDMRQFQPPTSWTPKPWRPRLLAVMSLDVNKDPLGLLHAFRDLRKKVPGASLTLLARAPLTPAVGDFVRGHGLSDAVALRDPCTRDEIARLMREACD